ncbi:hypothetical protein [Kitasatospora sp. MBT63]|uniref:hypothetical protein n=1 Tax=Kitasatospora sp. MBT63 TaxID=1444768 RepID=UPI0011EA6BCF|nr:hypothetical protein [Kitasatospora sp. MBT63]
MSRRKVSRRRRPPVRRASRSLLSVPARYNVRWPLITGVATAAALAYGHVLVSATPMPPAAPPPPALAHADPHAGTR